MNKKLTTEEFIEKARKIHGDKYDYSLVEYLGNKKNIKIIKDGIIFEQWPNTHLKGWGMSKKHSKIEFIEKAKKIHRNKYDYSLVEYKNDKTHVKIICPQHGIFIQMPNNHLNNHGCFKCKKSSGEIKISHLLDDYGINYIQEKKFNDCKNIRLLKFDFYLSDYNLCIEYNGIQHYYPKKYFGGKLNFEKIKKNDKIKTEYCNLNNINLLIIKYDENIENIILNYIKKTNQKI